MDRRPVNRIEPLHPLQAYQTYQIASPRDVAVKAACEAVRCEAWRHGWETRVDESTDIGRVQAAYIRRRSGRTFRERRTEQGQTVFVFEAGQRCFADHRTRPEIYAVRDGDWRGNPTGRVRRHTRPADWVEDFGEHQLKIVDQQQKG